MKSLLKIIQRTLPYHYYRNMIIVFSVFFIILCSGAIALSFVDVEPIVYDSTNLYDYMYVDIDKIYKVNDEFYIANDDQYIYVYHNKDIQEEYAKLKTISGIPSRLSDKELEKILPVFKKSYSHLNVKNIEELKEYIGLYDFDGSLPHLYIPVVICVFLSIIPLILILIYFAKYIGHHRKISSHFQIIIENNDANELKRQLQEPVHYFPGLNTAMLRYYLVINKPVPFAIDYNDIQWIYIEKKRWFFIFDKEIVLVLHDRDFKTTKVMYASAFSKKNKKEADIFVDYLSSINPKILVGYTPANRQIYYRRKRAFKKGAV